MYNNFDTLENIVPRQESKHVEFVIRALENPRPNGEMDDRRKDFRCFLDFLTAPVQGGN
jgi:hypothetical protein